MTTAPDLPAVVRQVEEAREQLGHLCAKAEDEDEDFGYIWAAAGHVRTLLDALSAAEKERDEARRANGEMALVFAEQLDEIAATERREGELREALERAFDHDRDCDEEGEGVCCLAAWRKVAILVGRAKNVTAAARTALAAPAEPTEKEGGEG